MKPAAIGCQRDAALAREALRDHLIHVRRDMFGS